MKWRSVLLTSVVLIAIHDSAYALTLDELLLSSATHFPKIAESRAALEAQKGKIQENFGAFDWELNQKAYARTSGFYTGDYVESQITRRLSESAARVYGGYRVSDGTFPIYEDQNETLTGGEFNAGIALSLWRNRIIDDDRFAYRDAQLEMKQKEVDLLLTQMGVQYDAMNAYFEWLAAGKALKVAENLLQLSQDRQEGFKKRVQKGDLAEIYLTENQQYIAKRQAEVNDARRLLENHAIKLSLYWRDSNGNMLLPDTSDMPGDFPESDVTIDVTSDVERAKAIRPELVHVDLGMSREKNKLVLNHNMIMPKVDLIAEGGRDVGAGANRFGGTESKVGINVSIPLQRNIGEGRISQSRARITQLEQQQRLLQDRITTEIQMAATNFHTASQNVTQAQKEIDASLAMEAAERERFNSGAADFFVLNMREERAADAQIKYIKSLLTLWRAVADYYIASFQQDRIIPGTT